MWFARCSGVLAFATAIALTLSSSGCSKGDKKNDLQAKAKDGKKDGDNGEAKHDAWWCAVHGVPEDECSQCLPEAKVKTKFKDKGDWCELHDRAKSQCFICDASKYKTFEDKYVARYGKSPERPPEEEFKR